MKRRRSTTWPAGSAVRASRIEPPRQRALCGSAAHPCALAITPVPSPHLSTPEKSYEPDRPTIRVTYTPSGLPTSELQEMCEERGLEVPSVEGGARLPLVQV